MGKKINIIIIRKIYENKIKFKLVYLIFTRRENKFRYIWLEILFVKKYRIILKLINL